MTERRFKRNSTYKKIIDC